MGGFCSSTRNYRIPGVDDEEEEGDDDLLTPRGMLRVQRWLLLVQQQCRPPVNDLDEHKEEKPPEEETTKVEETANEPSPTDPRLDPMTSTNLEYHQRLLRQQDKASGGAPLDGSFKIVATAVKPALMTPMSPSASATKFSTQDRNSNHEGSMVPSVGTELIGTISTVLSSRHMSEDSAAIQMVRSPTGAPHVNTGTRIAVKRGNYVNESSNEGTPTSKNPKPQSKDGLKDTPVKEAKAGAFSRDELDDIDEVAS